jgi:hypothetical protein
VGVDFRSAGAAGADSYQSTIHIWIRLIEYFLPTQTAVVTEFAATVKFSWRKVLTAADTWVLSREHGIA